MVGFRFLGGVDAAFLDEDVTFTVKENMGSFVKEGEPEEVVSLVTETELDERFVWSQPTGEAIDVGLGQLRDKDQGDPGTGTEAHDV